jgi:hypothetical protein
MISSFRLPFNFNPAALRSDLERIFPEEWVAHFNREYFEGEWSGAALRSAGGDARKLDSRVQAEAPFADTPIMQRCPYVREVLNTFQCKLQAVRFLKLAAGSTIREHRDYDLGFQERQLRLHLPIITNSEVVFFLDAQRIEMQAGECWYLDLSLPHWVENRGPVDRVHLVIDCELNEWLSGLLPADDSSEDELNKADQASSPEELQRFRQTVLNDLQLQRRLRETDDRESFIRLVAGLGRQLNYRFTTADVESALNSEQRAWFERWID